MNAMNKSVTNRKVGVLLAGVFALISQGAWSDEGSAENQLKAEDAKVAAAREQVEAHAREFIEALNRRLAEELQQNLVEIDAPRIELAIVEVPTRG